MNNESLFNIDFKSTVRHVLIKAAEDFRNENKFSKHTLLMLRCVFGSSFERALELFEKKKVTRFSVEQTRYVNKNRATCSFFEVKGQSTEVYTIFSNINFCSCLYFETQVLKDQDTFTCKHILAGVFHTMTMGTDHVFIAKLSNLKTVIQLLRSVNFKDSATCFGSQNGLKITVEDAKCMQASAYLSKDLFEEFILSKDFLFRININILVECLSMFWTSINSQGSTVVLEMQYKGVGHPVIILIEENGVIVDCSLKTREPDEILDFDLSPDSVVNKVILHSDLLKDVLSELDPSCSHLELFLSPKSPYFVITTRGTASEVQVQLPHNTDKIETFQCNKEAKSRYLLPHIKPAMKAMSCSNKVSLRTNDDGLLCFQYMLKSDDGVNCFIEYYVSPLINEDDD